MSAPDDRGPVVEARKAGGRADEGGARRARGGGIGPGRSKLL